MREWQSQSHVRMVSKISRRVGPEVRIGPSKARCSSYNLSRNGTNVHENYNPASEHIQDPNYRRALRLRALKRSA